MAMNTRYGIAVGVALLSALAIGTASIGRLHAQGKTPAYIVIDISETMDPEAYIKAVSAAEPNATQSAGGRFIVRAYGGCFGRCAAQSICRSCLRRCREGKGLVGVTGHQGGECHAPEGNEVASLF